MKTLLQLLGLTVLLAFILVIAITAAGHVDLHTPPPGLPTQSTDPHPVVIVTIQPEVTR